MFRCRLVWFQKLGGVVSEVGGVVSEVGVVVLEVGGVVSEVGVVVLEVGGVVSDEGWVVAEVGRVGVVADVCEGDVVAGGGVEGSGIAPPVDRRM